jgi:hypothetical protein
MKSLKSTTLAMLVFFALTAAANTVCASVTQQGRQSGRFVQFTRRATVRKFMGGGELAVQKVYQPGQWFHVYERMGNAAWAGGYVCLNGGRFCNQHDNIKGFVLRSSLPSLASIERQAPSSEPPLPAFTATADAMPFQNEVHYLAAGFSLSAAGSPAPARTVLRVCPGRRPVWLRNNKLHPIGYLTTSPSDRFVVDRPSPNGNWIMGWGYGGAVNPNNNYGRLLMSDEKGYKLMCR